VLLFSFNGTAQDRCSQRIASSGQIACRTVSRVLRFADLFTSCKLNDPYDPMLESGHCSSPPCDGVVISLSDDDCGRPRNKFLESFAPLLVVKFG
jgi:hypothetical protein